MRSRPSAHGFSLVEALIAIAITAVVFTAASQLLLLASTAARRARLVTRAAILATSKMEELESLAYGVAADGAALQDDGLAESADGSLTEDVPEYCDWFDSFGRVIPGVAARPAGATFVRRWSIRAVEGPGDTLAIQVLVTTGAGPPLAALTALRTRRGG